MKSLCLFILILGLNAHAAKDQRTLLKCLGQEERKFHKSKQTGPLYDLNQKLIAEMIQIPHAEIRAGELVEICQNPKVSPSWKLLELSISRKSAIFFVPEKVSGIQREMTIGMLDDYLDATKDILLGFLTQVQSLSPTPNCLKEEIPGLGAFFTDIKYLQEEIDMKKIFEGRDLKIFERLEEYPEAFQRCRERERLKKKAKPESTEADKKS